MVIENGIIRKLGYGFLFAFHSNYGSCIVLEIKQNIGQKSRSFHILLAFDAPVGFPSEY